MQSTWSSGCAVTGGASVMAALAVLKSGVDAVLKPVDTFLGFVDIHGVARAFLRRAVAFALACARVGCAARGWRSALFCAAFEPRAAGSRVAGS